MSKEVQPPVQLEFLRRRVERNRGLKSSSGIAGSAVEERLLDSIFNTTIARSEFLVTTEDLDRLEETIDRARTLLFSNGKSYIEHPQYPNLNRLFMTPEKEQAYANNYWYIIGEFQKYVLGQLPQEFNIVPGFTPGSEMESLIAPYEIHADKTQTKSDQDEEGTMGTRLRIAVIDGRNRVNITIGFDDSFVLEVDFFDDENWDKSKAAYSMASNLAYSVDFPLKSMTQEEYQIIDHYVQLFIKHITESE